MSNINKLITILTIFVTASLSAEDEANPEAEKIATIFMEHIEEGGYSSAFSYASLYWPIPEQEINTVAYQTETQLAAVATRYGKITGTELVKTDEIGESWVRYIYLQKFEKHSLKWSLIFYKSSEKWMVNAIMFDDQIHILFDK